MPRLRRYEVTAIAGFAILAVLLALGMVISIQRSRSAADAQMARMRAEEEEITQVERLRWNSERLLSSGRGYLLGGDPALLADFDESLRQFDRTMDEVLRGELTREAAVFAREAEQTAVSLVRAYRELMDARRQNGPQQGIVRRFEGELLPLSDGLNQSLSRLVNEQEAALQVHYEEAQRERSHLVVRLYIFLGILLFISGAIAAYFVRRLGRANQQQEEALQTARKAIAARDELIGVVAHDLRSPLGAVTTKAALIRMTSDVQLMQSQAESIEKIARRMGEMIRTMLDIARIEAGTFSVRPVPSPVDQLLRDATEMYETLAAARHVQLQQLSGRPGLTVMADRERTLQVFSNLLDNALKFTPPGGRVTVSAEQRGMHVQFAVRDTGSGVAREHLPHIFDRFWRPDASPAPGTGLGLFIVKGIIEAHGGNIRAESDPGHGSAFFVTLPMAAPETRVGGDQA